jgi:hypothetical protein
VAAFAGVATPANAGEIERAVGRDRLADGDDALDEGGGVADRPRSVGEDVRVGAVVAGGVCRHDRSAGEVHVRRLDEERLRDPLVGARGRRAVGEHRQPGGVAPGNRPLAGPRAPGVGDDPGAPGHARRVVVDGSDERGRRQRVGEA